MLLRIFKENTTENKFVFQLGTETITAFSLDSLAGKVKAHLQQHLKFGGAVCFSPKEQMEQCSLTANEKQSFWDSYHK